MPSPTPDTSADELCARYLTLQDHAAAPSFESWCAQHLAQATELRALHAQYG